MKIFYLTGLFIFFIISTCISAAENKPQQPINDLEHTVGWMHGNCLAIADETVPAGTALDIVKLDGQLHIQGRVMGKADNSDTCPALLDDRKAVNMADGFSFYQVATSQPINLAIAYLSGITIDKRAVFSSCMTSEGINFNVTTDHSQLWQGYYYLGYDVEPSCQ